MLRCSVIVVTYNSAEASSACLEALAREDCEIVVVDNASQDETVQRVEEFVAWHAVRLLANDSENLGFAAAVNQAARRPLEMFCWCSIPTPSPSRERSKHCCNVSKQPVQSQLAVRSWRRRTTSARLHFSTAANSRNPTVRGDAGEPTVAAQSA